MRGIAEVLKKRRLMRGVQLRCGVGGRVVHITNCVAHYVEVAKETPRRSRACSRM